MRKRIFPLHMPELLSLALVTGLALSVVRATDQQGEAKPKQPVAEAIPTGIVTAEMWKKASTNALQPGEIDTLISGELSKLKLTPSPRTTDEQFLRRVSLDLTGRLPAPVETAAFLKDPDPNKRAKLIDKLLSSGDFAKHWGRYWYDVVNSRVTNNLMRISAGAFERWLTEQFQANKRWDEVTRTLLTANGEIRFDGTQNDGSVYFLLSRRGADAVSERAAETSRIFLGIQIQCAQCHDHPSDVWKRQQFHEFAAYFGKLRDVPIFEEMRVLGFRLTTAFQDYQMPDANNPQKKIAVVPRFLDGKSPPGAVATGPKAGLGPLAKGKGAGGIKGPGLKGILGKGGGSPLTDEQRRKALADAITSRDNPWFAAAFVNRVWGELMGQSFYMPIDDLGPQKEAVFPSAIARMAGAFRGSNYDIKGLYRAILNSETYQRQVRPGESPEEHVLFSAAFPTRLRADALYRSLSDVLGDLSAKGPLGKSAFGKGGPFKGAFGPENQFKQEFDFDPSSRPEDVEGSVAKALLMMNNPAINQKIKASGNNVLAQILSTYSNDDEAIRMVYVRTLARRPTDRELTRCREYVRSARNRAEGFEDILWALINSTEFQTRR